MAIIINRSSPGDAVLNAVLSPRDAVGAKFYHHVTKFYHHVTLRMMARYGCQRERKNDANQAKIDL